MKNLAANDPIFNMEIGRPTTPPPRRAADGERPPLTPEQMRRIVSSPIGVLSTCPAKTCERRQIGSKQKRYGSRRKQKLNVLIILQGWEGHQVDS